MKRAEDINIPYFLEHSKDIINNTEVLLPEWLFWGWDISEDFDRRYYWNQLVQKHRRESGNWYIFGRGDRWVGPGETWEEAEDRIVREYCEATGHWDLFIWKEVKE